MAPLHIAVVPDTVTVGNGFTVTAALPVCVWLHVVIGFKTLTKLTVLVAVLLATKVAVPDPFKVILVFAPPFTLYVTTAFAVPVNV